MKTQAELEKENATLKARIKELETLNNWYMQQLKLSRQKQFGQSSESTKHEDVEQINLFNEAEAERQPLVAEPELTTVIYQRKKSKRGESIQHLPVEVIEYTLPKEEQSCPACHEALHIMSKEVRKELSIIPAQLKVIEHVTYVYSCRHCEKTAIETPVIRATAPKALLTKSMVSAELLAYILNQKFVNAMPLYRQEQEFKRLGIKLSRQNLSNWIIKGAMLLTPLLERFKQQLLQHSLLHADETTLEVLCEPGRPAQTTSYMWVYRTAGDAKHPIVLYDYQEGRSGRFAKQFLSGFSGYLNTDGWNGYHQLLDQGVTLCGCWAHARRKFHEAMRITPGAGTDSPEAIGLSYCNQLFEIEKRIEALAPEERLAVRKQESQPLLDAFFTWVDRMSERTLPQNLLGKALTYAQNQKQYLLSFLADGRIEISNNRAERSIKPFVIGRKNWLFCNTPGGAKSSAAIYSLMQTALENGLKPQAYLEYVFKRIQQQQDQLDLATVLPWADEIPIHCKMSATKS